MKKTEKALSSIQPQFRTIDGLTIRFAESVDPGLNRHALLLSPCTDGSRTNPKQLFTTGWSACFEGAMDIAARKKRIALPADTAIDAEVDLCSDKGEYFLQARLNISIPGLEWDVSQQLVDEAHRTCPYTKAINGNVHVASSICCKAIYKPIIPSILKRSL